MNSKRILVFLGIILLLAILSILSPQLQTLTGHAINQDYYPKEQAILDRVIDGDTIKDQFDQSYRLLGINNTKV
jgi:endonuclease YncB( thermonuclease family)